MIQLLLPRYMAEAEVTAIDQLANDLIIIETQPDLPTFNLDQAIPADRRQEIERHDGLFHLLALAGDVQADGLVTRSPVLLKARYLLLQWHQIRVVPFDELADAVEVCAHGHSIFWSVAHPDRRLTFDIFYQTAHPKANRLFTWFNSKQASITDNDLKQNLQSVLTNRYPFILFTRDMIRFYELQRDYFTRRGLMVRFGMTIGYYVTTFFLLLWGALDHLTVLTKYALCLQIDERRCGIRSKEFWDELGPIKPGLRGFVERENIAKWIDMMADMRHAAAHRVLNIPTLMLVETEESGKTDEEIREIVRQERRLLYEMLGEEVMRQQEPVMIWHWRVSKMKKISQGMVLIKGRDQEYYRDPVISVDHDLEYLTAVIDAFLIGLFE